PDGRTSGQLRFPEVRQNAHAGCLTECCSALFPVAHKGHAVTGNARAFDKHAPDGGDHGCLARNPEISVGESFSHGRRHRWDIFFLVAYGAVLWGLPNQRGRLGIRRGCWFRQAKFPARVVGFAQTRCRFHQHVTQGWYLAARYQFPGGFGRGSRCCATTNTTKFQFIVPRKGLGPLAAIPSIAGSRLSTPLDNTSCASPGWNSMPGPDGS